MKLKEGPSLTIIPEQRYNSCFGCMYFTSSLSRSGLKKEHRQSCEHEEIPEEYRVPYSLLKGNLTGIKETPGWCPFLYSKEMLTEKKKKDS